MRAGGHAFERAEGARGHADADAIQDDNLEVNVLAAFGRDIRMASGLAEDRGFAGELIDA